MQKHKQPPLADGLPLVGSVLSLANDSIDFICRQYQKHGSVFRVRALNNEFKVLAGPELNLRMASEPEVFSAWDVWADIVKDFGARKTIAMIDGAEHTQMRSLMRHSFSKHTLTNNLPPTIEVIRGRIHEPNLHERVPVVEFIQQITADTLGLLSNERVPGEYFKDIVFWWNTLIEVYFVRKHPPQYLQSETYVKARTRVKEFARQIMADRKREGAIDEDANFLDNLATTNANSPDTLSEDEALFLSLAAYFAGLDTVANVTSFLLYELLKHPDVLARVRQESDALFANGAPSAEGMRNMHTLHNAAKETLRMYPIAGVLPRYAAKDFEFEGYPIKEGEFFMAAVAATHFSPHIYKDPYVWDIERYDAPRSEHKTRGAFAPFGSGPHTCLGAGLAEVQIATITATLLHEADFVLDPPNYKLKRTYTPSLSPKDFGIHFTEWRQG